MTLSQWAAQHDILVNYWKESTCAWVPWRISLPARTELFHLSDYVVSSLTAGTYWLVTREPSRHS